MSSSESQALSLESSDVDTADTDGPPLDERILQIVKASPDYTLRPARLAAELGISVTDACAELCGLLQAVGGGANGASFRFETVDDASEKVMVFSFPSDFEQRARRKRRATSLWQALQIFLTIAVKVLKIATAFGLILSLTILCVAAIVGTIAALVALARGGQDRHHRSTLMRYLRTLFFTLRQLLWCYALFGRNAEGQDPFLSEIAYDLYLVFSLCSRPGSFLFWIRANQLRQRRLRSLQGWSGRQIESEIEGVSLVQRGNWGEDEHDSANGDDDEDHRGLLSVAVEFLFGPVPFQPGPSEHEKWKLRGAVLVQLSSKSNGKGVPLEDVSPYVESPPASLEDTARIVEQGLLVTAHFNGTPVKAQTSPNPEKARFVFPELMAESSVAMRYDDAVDEDDNDGTWSSLLYAKESPAHGGSRRTTAEEPRYLRELSYRFTKLTSTQFFYCLLMGSLNLIGVVWLGNSVSPGGVLNIPDGTSLAWFLRKGLLPVLKFYAILFFVLPGARLLLIIVLNSFRRQRNVRRELLARVLKARGD